MKCSFGNAGMTKKRKCPIDRSYLKLLFVQWKPSCKTTLKFRLHNLAERDQLPCSRNLFWQLPRDGSLNGLGMSHATMTACPKPSFRAPWREGDVVVSRGNVGLTTSKSGHPSPCQNSSQGPSAEKTEKRISAELSLMPPPPPNNPIGQRTELK